MTTLKILLQQKAKNVEKVKNALSTFNHHELIQTVLNELDALLLENDKEKAFALAECLRDKLLLERNKQVNDAAYKNYYSAIHHTLILLACYWPKNVESGKCEDPIDCEFITGDSDVVPVSQGYLYKKSEIFLNHFQRVDKKGNSFILKEMAEEGQVSGLLSERMTEFDLLTLQESGVDIPGMPPLPSQVYENALAYRRSLFAVMFQRQQDWLWNIQRVFHPQSLLEWGALLLGLVGVAGGLSLFWPVISVGVASLTPTFALALAALGGVAMITGFIRGRFEGYVINAQEDFSSFSQRLVTGNLSLMIALAASVVLLGVMTLLAPYLAGALVSLSLLTTTQAAVFSANMGFIVPAALGVIGLLSEAFSPGGMSRFFVNCLVVFPAIPGLIAKEMGMVLGAIGHFGAVWYSRLTASVVLNEIPIEQTPLSTGQDVFLDNGTHANVSRWLGAGQDGLNAAHDVSDHLNEIETDSIKQALNLSDEQDAPLLVAEQEAVFQAADKANHSSDNMEIEKPEQDQEYKTILSRNRF